MPLSQDPGKRESDRYCSFCFKDGKLTYEGNDVKEFKKASYEAMIKKGMNKYTAKFYTFMIGFAPRWKEKKPAAK
jgi:hypothetical protein